MKLEYTHVPPFVPVDAATAHTPKAARDAVSDAEHLNPAAQRPLLSVAPM